MDSDNVSGSCGLVQLAGDERARRFVSTQTHNCVSSLTWFTDESDRVDFLD